MFDVILKRFEQPDEARKFEKGKFELIQAPHSEGKSPTLTKRAWGTRKDQSPRGSGR